MKPSALKALSLIGYLAMAGGGIAVTWPRYFLRAEIDRERLQFSASADGQTWQFIGPVLDASKLSDDYGQGLHFTGALVGLCAQDLAGTRQVADFDYFVMK